MNCRRARNLLFDFFDGSSNETLRAEVERHLGECTECEQFASEMTRSLALLKRTPVEPLDENFNWKVKLAIHRERNAALSRARSAGAWVRMWNIRYAVSGGLAFGAVLVAGMLAVERGVIVLPTAGRAPSSEIAGSTAPAREPSVASGATTRQTRPPRANNDLKVLGEEPHLVSLGQGNAGGSSSPVNGAIDKTEAEARIDSLINSEMMQLNAHERERYIQRRLETIQRLREQVQSQQSNRTQP